MTAPAAPARVRGFDLLRGLAVLPVMLRHAFPDVFPGAGVVGVVMFFAISGYLISGGLFREVRLHGRIDLRGFYRRRVLRLVPALLQLVAGVVVVTLVLDPLGDRDVLVRTVVVALTWTANLPFSQGSVATYHLWTLATEEQLYLLWPALLVLLARRRPPSPGARGAGVARTGLLVAGVASVVACVATVWWFRDAPDLAYALPTSWAGCFVLGGVARWYADREAAGAGRVWRPGPWVATVLLVALATLSLLPVRGHTATYVLVGPAVAAAAGLLMLAWGERSGVGYGTSPLTRGLVLLGTVSYGAYLWNYPLTLWLRPSAGAWAGPLALVLTLVLAALSWQLVERPTARWGARRPRRTSGSPREIGASVASGARQATERLVSARE